jgi:hypothetical protein
MAKNTGPGKVSDNLDKPTPRPGVAGLLFNFDVDGDAVKREHQDWLLANALPLLACQHAAGSLKGMASRSGSASYNLQLSERRVANVKKVLTGQGADPGKLNMVWVGEEAAALAGAKDGTEEERDRAVAISIQLPPRRGILRFTRVDPEDVEDGFDAGATPSWLMVPMFERRQLVLLHGEGVRLVTTRAGVVQFISPVSNLPVNELVVTSARQVIQFTGNLPGEAAVEAHDLATGEVERLLEIDVLAGKRMVVALHFVTDPQHPTPKRTVASVGEMVREAQRLYRRQANITIDPVSDIPDTIVFAQNLSDPTALPEGGQRPVTPATTGGVEFPVLTNRGNAAARVNVFYLWEWQSGVNDTNGKASALGGRGVVLEDDTSSPAGKHEGYTFAHELGHCLGLEHVEATNVANKVRLMWRFTNEHLGKLTRDEVRTARKSL